MEPSACCGAVDSVSPLCSHACAAPVSGSRGAACVLASPPRPAGGEGESSKRLWSSHTSSAASWRKAGIRRRRGPATLWPMHLHACGCSLSTCGCSRGCGRSGSVLTILTMATLTMAILTGGAQPGVEVLERATEGAALPVLELELGPGLQLAGDRRRGRGRRRRRP
eukprot:scaffold27625_cov33-Phaeocystis_antarctica.AAC.1